MTIVVSGVLPNLITVTVDSAITNSSAGLVLDYEIARKLFVYEGVGYVATWGARDGVDNLRKFLEKQNISSETHNVRKLASLVDDYLRNHYCPHSIDPHHDEVGYHIGGFNQEGKPQLYHIFWGINNPPEPDEIEPNYHRQHIVLTSGSLLLYNGRNDLANLVIRKLISEIKAGKQARYNPSDPFSIVLLGDLIARFAAELTPEVGPPFITLIVAPNNKFETLARNNFTRLENDRVLEKLVKLDYGFEGSINEISAHERTIQNIVHVLEKSSLKKCLVVRKLFDELRPYLHLDDNNSVCPDLIVNFASNPQFFAKDDGHYYGVPTIIIEVISPQSRVTDRIVNFELYAEHKLKELWLVDIYDEVVEIWSFRYKTPRRITFCTIGDEGFTSKALSIYVNQDMVEIMLGKRRR